MQITEKLEQHSLNIIRFVPKFIKKIHCENAF